MSPSLSLRWEVGSNPKAGKGKGRARNGPWGLLVLPDQPNRKPGPGGPGRMGKVVCQDQYLEKPMGSAKGDSILGEARGPMVMLPLMPRVSGSGQAWA